MMLWHRAVSQTDRGSNESRGGKLDNWIGDRSLIDQSSVCSSRLICKYTYFIFNFTDKWDFCLKQSILDINIV